MATSKLEAKSVYLRDIIDEDLLDCCGDCYGGYHGNEAVLRMWGIL